MRRFLFVLLLCPASALAQQSLSFKQPSWVFTGDSTSVRNEDGRTILAMETGEAVRRDVKLQDGTIDVDVKVTRRRSFVYVNFRMQNDREYEEFYLRPHKTLMPDAVQYSPVFQGQSSWQLYHGPGDTGARDIPIGTWTHLRIVLSGREAAVFLGDTATPILLIPRLGHDAATGYVSLASFVPPGTPGSGAAAKFADLVVRPGYVPFQFPQVPAQPPPASGVVREWAVGASFPVSDSGVTTLKPEWLRFSGSALANTDGLVELNKQVQLPQLPPPFRYWGVAAHVNVDAREAGVRRFDLSFSDQATVFLNGAPVFKGDESYDYPNRRDGLSGFGETTLFLPLNKGPNDLTIVVSDRFGGWGLMGRFSDTIGLRVSR